MTDLGRELKAFARFEISVLRSLASVFGNWSSNELDILRIEGEAGADLESASDFEEHSERMFNKQVMFERTRQAMYCTLSVAISSTFERFIDSICTWKPIKIPNPNGDAARRPDIAAKKRAIERELNIRFESLPSSQNLHRIRALSNCYKHNRGRVQVDYATRLERPANSPIVYSDENWPELIENLEEHLLALANFCCGQESAGLEKYDDYVGLVDE